jgi:hypothetical protein
MAGGMALVALAGMCDGISAVFLSGQMNAMKTLLSILVVLGMLATLGTMLIGVAGVGKEGRGARSNRLMRYRVLLQGLTLLLFALLMMTR